MLREEICRRLAQCCEWLFCADCGRCYCECNCHRGPSAWREGEPDPWWWRDEWGQGASFSPNSVETVNVREEFL